MGPSSWETGATFLTSSNRTDCLQFGVASANQLRPTVLIMAPKAASPRGPALSATSTPDKSSVLMRALQNAEKKWSGAVALMALAGNSTPQTAHQ